MLYTIITVRSSPTRQPANFPMHDETKPIIIISSTLHAVVHLCSHGGWAIAGERACEWVNAGRGEHSNLQIRSINYICLCQASAWLLVVRHAIPKGKWWWADSAIAHPSTPQGKTITYWIINKYAARVGGCPICCVAVPMRGFAQWPHIGCVTVDYVCLCVACMVLGGLFFKKNRPSCAVHAK